MRLYMYAGLKGGIDGIKDKLKEGVSTHIRTSSDTMVTQQKFAHGSNARAQNCRTVERQLGIRKCMKTCTVMMNTT